MKWIRSEGCYFWWRYGIQKQAKDIWYVWINHSEEMELNWFGGKQPKRIIIGSRSSFSSAKEFVEEHHSQLLQHVNVESFRL